MSRTTRLLTATALALTFGAALAACGGDEPEAKDPAAEGVACEYPGDGTSPAKEVDPPPAQATDTGAVSATMTTSVGDLELSLDADAAPCTVNSFVSLANQGYFDATKCHRLTTQGIFVLQCGDPTASGMGGPGYSFADELTGEEQYAAGTLAMANAGPGTNGSQFFIVYEDSLGLPPNYTVFGTVGPDSIKLVQKLAKKGTDNGSADGAPKVPVEIDTVTVG